MLAIAGPPAHEVPVDQARAGHEAETVNMSGPGEEVAEAARLRNLFCMTWDDDMDRLAAALAPQGGPASVDERTYDLCVRVLERLVRTWATEHPRRERNRGAIEQAGAVLRDGASRALVDVKASREIGLAWIRDRRLPAASAHFRTHTLANASVRNPS